MSYVVVGYTGLIGKLDGPYYASSLVEAVKINQNYNYHSSLIYDKVNKKYSFNPNGLHSITASISLQYKSVVNINFDLLGGVEKELLNFALMA